MDHAHGSHHSPAHAGMQSSDHSMDMKTLRHKLLLRAACNNQCERAGNSYGGPSCPGCPNSSDSNSNKGYLNPVESNEEVHVNVFSNSYREKLRSRTTHSGAYMKSLRPIFLQGTKNTIRDTAMTGNMHWKE
ncbi:unnamed protein product [Schistosoma mattheei]|uniref:Uncharacterized protein n=1 Tax=Schistosoma mattheei TaxID=31246 RepID=A0A183PMG5_9TREM|nr:unnamed protein product [Schistosoma mattheei]